MPNAKAVKAVMPKKPIPGFDAAFADGPPSNRRGFCLVARYVAEHPNGAAIRTLVEDPRWSSAELGRRFRSLGLDIRDTAINDHRRVPKRCACNLERPR